MPCTLRKPGRSAGCSAISTIYCRGGRGALRAPAAHRRADSLAPRLSFRRAGRRGPRLSGARGRSRVCTGRAAKVWSFRSRSSQGKPQAATRTPTPTGASALGFGPNKVPDAANGRSETPNGIATKCPAKAASLANERSLRLPEARPELRLEEALAGKTVAASPYHFTLYSL